VVHAGTGRLLKLVVAPLLTHALALVRAVHPSVPAGDVLVADRGRCSYAPLARLAQAGMHAVRRVSARQLVACTPGRPWVTPGVRRTPAVKGLPRSRWRQALGADDPLVTWLKPKPRPSWLTREALAALPEALGLPEVRDHIGTPGFRTREITLVTTPLEAEAYRVSDRAELSRRRWQVEPALAQLQTGMQREVRHGQTVAGTLKELTILAMVDNLVRLGMRPSAALQPTAAARIRVLDALRWLGAPRTGMPLVGLIVNPRRPPRVEPWVKQRRPKPFPLMLKPRQERHQQLIQQAFRSSLHAIRLLAGLVMKVEALMRAVGAGSRGFAGESPRDG
jgi:hypothetical protein